MSGGFTNAACAVTLPIGGSSSWSSSLNDRCEFRELVYGAYEACQHCSDTTSEVSPQERCHEAIRVALEALERETT